MPIPKERQTDPDWYDADGKRAFEDAGDPTRPGPKFDKGSVFHGVSVVIDQNGVWWRVDANEGSLRQVFRFYRIKGSDEFEIGGRLFREVKRDKTT
jgi:hypothetical protein